ncbi:hypothetical protein BDR26DRAFT_696870 [Obelidium mucronatum]|nr:hypothetical protein BDR26DRAFT_696870 [Obelidium mucronatum]
MQGASKTVETTLREEIVSAQALVSSLEQHVDELEANNAALTTKLQGLVVETESLQEQLAKSKLREGSLEERQLAWLSTEADLRAEVASSRVLSSNLQEQVNESAISNATLDKKVETLTVEIEFLQTQLADAKNHEGVLLDMQGASKTVETTLREEIVSAQALVSSLEQHVDELEANNAALTTKLQGLVVETESLQEQLAKSKLREGSLEERQLAWPSTEADLRAEVASSRVLSSNLQEQVHELAISNAALEKKVGTLTVEIELLQTQIGDAEMPHLISKICKNPVSEWEKKDDCLQEGRSSYHDIKDLDVTNQMSDPMEAQAQKPSGRVSIINYIQPGIVSSDSEKWRSDPGTKLLAKKQLDEAIVDNSCLQNECDTLKKRVYLLEETIQNLHVAGAERTETSEHNDQQLNLKLLIECNKTLQEELRISQQHCKEMASTNANINARFEESSISRSLYEIDDIENLQQENTNINEQLTAALNESAIYRQDLREYKMKIDILENIITKLQPDNAKEKVGNTSKEANLDCNQSQLNQELKSSKFMTLISISDLEALRHSVATLTLQLDEEKTKSQRYQSLQSHLSSLSLAANLSSSESCLEKLQGGGHQNHSSTIESTETLTDELQTPSKYNASKQGSQLSGSLGSLNGLQSMLNNEAKTVVMRLSHLEDSIQEDTSKMSAIMKEINMDNEVESSMKDAIKGVFGTQYERNIATKTKLATAKKLVQQSMNSFNQELVEIIQSLEHLNSKQTQEIKNLKLKNNHLASALSTAEAAAENFETQIKQQRISIESVLNERICSQHELNTAKQEKNQLVIAKSQADKDLLQSRQELAYQQEKNQILTLNNADLQTQVLILQKKV